MRSPVDPLLPFSPLSPGLPGAPGKPREIVMRKMHSLILSRVMSLINYFLNILFC